MAGGMGVIGLSVSAYGASSAAASHIMVVMMENEGQGELIGNPAAPNTNALATHYGLATQSYSIGHVSLINYLELLSGSTYGVTADGTPSLEGVPSSAQTLVNQLETAGISWRAYMESMPSAGYIGGDTACCGGQYYQHHNPFVYFPSVTSLPDFNTNMVPSTNLLSDLNSPTPPDFVWMKPNGTDDMHDGPVNPNGDVNRLVRPRRQHHHRVGRGLAVRCLGRWHCRCGRWSHRHDRRQRCPEGQSSAGSETGERGRDPALHRGCLWVAIPRRRRSRRQWQYRRPPRRKIFHTHTKHHNDDYDDYDDRGAEQGNRGGAPDDSANQGRALDTHDRAAGQGHRVGGPDTHHSCLDSQAGGTRSTKRHRLVSGCGGH
jgi:hypothetical protein